MDGEAQRRGVRERQDADRQHRPALQQLRRREELRADGASRRSCTKDGVSIFAGQRDDPFFADVGAIFDLVAIRKPGTTGNMGGGKDFLSGYNVHTIALQIPISQVDNASHTIGVWAAANRKNVTVNGHLYRGWTQVSRLGNPLINEVVIPTGEKDLWNRTTPQHDAQFKKYYKTPILAAVLNKLYKLGVPETGRDDLVAVLGTGIPKLNVHRPEVRRRAAAQPLGAGRGAPEPDGRARRATTPASRTAAGSATTSSTSRSRRSPASSRARRCRSATASTATTRRTSRTSRTCRRRTGATRTRRRRTDDRASGARAAARVPVRLLRRPMSTKLLIAAAALVAAGFAALFGGVLAKRTAAPPDALAAAQSAEDFKAGFALEREHARARAEPPGDAPREPGGRALVGAPRARLPAAGARDRRPGVLHEVGRRAPARALARPEGSTRLQRARLARALAAPLRDGAQARSAGARRSLRRAPATSA